jgi:hypothetical protein
MLLPLLLGCSTEASESAAAVSATLRLNLDNISVAGDLETSTGGVDLLVAPGLLIVHEPGWAPFHDGDALAGTAMESLGEDGDPGPFATSLEGQAEVHSVHLIAAQDADTYKEAVMGPGGHASVELTLTSDERLSFVAMFGQSNDVVIASPPGGVSLLKPDGTLAAIPLSLFDAGTERNQEPGVGDAQAPRQDAPNTGEPNERTASRIDGYDVEGWAYPDPFEFVMVAGAKE